MNNKEKAALIKLMTEKSQESFLMAIEVYNKPTLKYRVEGFCFFICNAWELLLKAHLINKGQSIFYKDKKKNQNRTISLSDSIKKVFTNDKDPLRKNLEIVVGIRNMASHLIIPEYAVMLNDVFLACVKNYSLKLKSFLGVTINDKIQTDFLTMFVPRDPTTINIEGEYGKEVFRKYIDTKTFLSHVFADNTNDKNVVNESLALSYELTFKTVSDINAADFTVAKVAPGKSQIGVIKVQQEIDPNKTHPLSCKQLVTKVQEEMLTKNISFTPVSPNAKKEFTTAAFHSLNSIFQFKNDRLYAYAHNVGNSTNYTYSLKLVQRIINIFLDNPDILLTNKKR